MQQQPSAREQHRAAVLDLLHRGEQLTRSEIARRLSLTRTTVSDVLSDILESGIVTVIASQGPGGRGRPAEILGIHPGAVRYIGVDFTHAEVTVCLANYAATVIATQSCACPPDTSWEERLRRSCELIENLTVGEIYISHLAGIGVGVPGPNPLAWSDLTQTVGLAEPLCTVGARVREFYQEAYGCPVAVDHHIRFAAMYEAASSAEPRPNIIYLRLSTRIGGAMVSSGSVVHGAHLLAGEIGHIVVDESTSARQCRCQRIGCLETVAALGPLLEQWRSLTGTEATLVNLTAAAQNADRQAITLLSDVADTVGRALGIAATIADPDEIVLAGEVGELLTFVMPSLREAISRNCLTGSEIQVRIAASDGTQGARGAIAAVRSADHSPDTPTTPFPGGANI